MDEISVKGKKYLKAKVVARELGYTNDYIGQLCRSGKVDAELVGRTWYVNPESVRGHKSTRYRSAKATTKRELKSDVLQAMLKEQQQGSSEHFYTKHHVRKHAKQATYQSDETELIPLTRDEEQKSVTLPVELADAKQVKVDTNTDKEYHFESPEREETKFFGTLRVTDFMTEVPVEGLNQRAQTVPVTGKPHDEALVKRKKVSVETKQPLDAMHETFKTQPPTPTARFKEKVLATPPKTAAIPVTGEEEAVPVPIAYRMVMVTAFILALVVAAASIGLQASVTATNQNTDVEYAFTVENLSALIFPVK